RPNVCGRKARTISRAGQGIMVWSFYFFPVTVVEIKEDRRLDCLHKDWETFLPFPYVAIL
ncbi:hypothetical protein, partial [Akkermansia sp.]|uniref:hypothetical protein n=1 Tax=Akkermansia sp. TaxID=1872421 RepID=UPI003AB583D8